MVGVRHGAPERGRAMEAVFDSGACWADALEVISSAGLRTQQTIDHASRESAIGHRQVRVNVIYMLCAKRRECFEIACPKSVCGRLRGVDQGSWDSSTAAEHCVRSMEAVGCRGSGQEVWSMEIISGCNRCAHYSQK